MENVLIFVLFAVGIVLIVKGGDYFVDSSVWIAEVSGIPKFIVGATIVSFATTLPELLVSVIAAAGGKTDMAIGNAVGSVTANVGIIMAVSLIFIPGAIKRKAFAPKALIMCAAVLLLWLLSGRGELKLVGAVIILALFVFYVIENVYSTKKSLGEEKTQKREHPEKKEIIVNVLKFIGGAAGIVIGARLLVDNGSKIAQLIGIPESIISVTVIAIGTSLPELVTTIAAIVKKQANLSVGNIIGANIIDLTVIMPVCALISGGSLPVSRQSAVLDLPFCALLCVISVVPALILSKFKKVQGVVMLAAYVVYLVLLAVFFI